MPPLPRLDALYWITLLAACGMGETTGDLISHGLNLGYLKASALLGALFIAAMVVEFQKLSPLAARYWVSVVITSTVGTTLADLTTRTLGLGYFYGSLILIALFAVIFATWHRRKSAGETDRRYARSVEIHYWAAFLVSSTMGTTLGDFVSNDTPLGFGGSSILLAALLGAVLLITRFSRLPRMLTYWTALVLTSTFGAASGDYLTKEEGVNLGPFKGTAVLACFLLVVITVSSVLSSRAKAA
jgi:uncharacterized membrane-anchored protein